MISVTHTDVFALEYQPFKGSYGHKDRKLYLLLHALGSLINFFQKQSQLQLVYQLIFFRKNLV